AAKRRRLERAGWRVGTTKEFLGLSEDEHAMVELKLQLANALRTERAKRGLTQAELSKEVGSSQSRVAKMEAGDATVSLDLLVRSLFKMGVTRARVARYLKPQRKRRAA